MTKTKKNNSADVFPSLELDEITKAAIEQLPDSNTEGKVELEIPNLDLKERRFKNGPTTFFSIFSGSKYAKGEGPVKDGKATDYIDTWNTAGKIFVSQSGRKIFLTPLDVIALLELLKEHEEFFSYQVRRQRADLKEEIDTKAKYL